MNLSDTFPLSRSFKNEVSEEVIEVWQQDEPQPRLYVIDGLVPTNAVSILYGDGGQGKSLLAVYLAILACLGYEFASRTVQPQVCLYLDAELDKDEFIRRAYSVARGLGLDRPPMGLHYYRLNGPLSSKRVQEEVQRVAESCNATFIILDSLTISTFATDPTAAHDITGIMRYLESLGTVLAIDHVAKPQPGTDATILRPFGSAFKHNIARSVIHVIGTKDGITLHQIKHNFGPKASPLALNVDFADTEVRYTVRNLTSNEMATLHQPTSERIYAELLSRDETGATIGELSQALQISEKTVSNNLTALNSTKRVERLGGGRWRVINCNEASQMKPIS